LPHQIEQAICATTEVALKCIFSRGKRGGIPAQSNIYFLLSLNDYM
jgi:hypothetical protein